MNPTMALDLGRQTLMMVLVISAPLLIIGLVVGVAVSILQAVTQIQEMTLTFVPKIFIMVLAAAALMPWYLSHLMTYAIEMFSPMPVP